MIETAHPADWKQLQDGVCRLLNEVGLSAETEKKLQTPRGEVEIDVYAVDENSVDKIRYLVECKNWASAIPQSVVHSFTTVMDETGGNIGYIVSREGFQSGAQQYLKNTNIIGVSYAELQKRYFGRWCEKSFLPTIRSANNTLFDYVSVWNGDAERRIQGLPVHKQAEARRLREKYLSCGMMMFVFDSHFPILGPERIGELKAKIVERLGSEFSFSSEYYRELAHEIAAKLQSITNEFHNVFGKNKIA